LGGDAGSDENVDVCVNNADGDAGSDEKVDACMNGDAAGDKSIEGDAGGDTWSEEV